jgi:hypothetical protein
VLGICPIKLEIVFRYGDPSTLEEIDYHGYTTPFNVFRSRNSSCVDELTKGGSDLHFRTGPGYAPLHLTFQLENLQRVKLILSNDVDVNSLSDEVRLQ